jgi:hypothetical protein
MNEILSNLFLSLDPLGTFLSPKESFGQEEIKNIIVLNWRLSQYGVHRSIGVSFLEFIPMNIA